MNNELIEFTSSSMKPSRIAAIALAPQGLSFNFLTIITPQTPLATTTQHVSLRADADRARSCDTSSKSHPLPHKLDLSSSPGQLWQT
ncbi:MAG: hypothetical protein HC866_02175 [Leptolyngbyaceae cyanobacterium RU_5_1]|nr:hypothetical protein [Leptolyngbyaceae cyanobacterium RU_5_1]